MEKIINNYCIVRGDRSGVFFGIVKSVNGQLVEMEEVRRIHYWEGAASISQIAVDGVKFPRKCRITVVVDNVIILDCIEINVCEKKAIENLKAVPVWKQ